MPITSRQMPTLLEGTKKILITALENALKEAVYPNYINDEGGTNKKSESMQDYEPMGALPIWPENTSLEELEMYEGWALRVSQVAFGGKVLITKQMRKFDQADLIESATMQLGNSSILTRDLLLVAYFIYGHEAVANIPTLQGVPIITPKTGDGQPLFSETHKWRSSDQYNWSNLMSAYIQPTETGVFTMHKQIARWKGPNGQPLMIDLKKLQIPIELEQLVEKHWKSRQEANTANNAVNTMRKFLPDGYFVNKYLPSAADWIGMTSAKKGRIRLKWGWKDETGKIGLDDHTQTSGVRTDFSYCHGVNIPLGYVLSRQA